MHRATLLTRSSGYVGAAAPAIVTLVLSGSTTPRGCRLSRWRESTRTVGLSSDGPSGFDPQGTHGEREPQVYEPDIIIGNAGY